MASKTRPDGEGTSRGESELQEPQDVFEKSMGVFGRWHIWICFLIFLCKFPIAWHQLSHVFLAPKVSFTCNNNSDKCAANCDKHIFNRSVFTETIVTQWDLVCEKKILGTLTQTVAMFGILVGSMTFGYLADRFGRTHPLTGAVALQAITGIISAFSPWFPLFLVMRFLSTVATGGSMVTSFVLIMELIGIKWRTHLGLLYQIPFNLGHLTLPLFSYLIRDWKYFQAALSIPSFFLISYYWLLPPSPRWLITVGKTEAAIATLEKAARHNKLPTEHIREDIENFVQTRKVAPKRGGNFVDLVRTPVMRTYTICIGFNWLVCGLCFYGGAQYIKQLGGNIFVNQAIAAALTIPGTLFSMWSTKAWGRKWTLIFADVITGTCCILIATLPKNPIWVKIALAGINMFSLMISFPTVYIYAGELFPTIVRNVGIGTCSMLARWGSMIAPFIADAEDLGKIQTWVAPAVFGVIAIIGGVLCFKLPETLDCILPDTIEEAEEFKKKKETKKS